MKLITQTPKRVLNKAFLKQRPLRSDIDLFKNELITLLDHIDPLETEEFHKNLVSNFLKKAIYQDNNFINTKGRQDLVIHNGKDNKTQVGIIIEAKRPTNKADWFTADNPNGKALHELVLYYLRERIEANNIDIKYLVATNINEWYIIEAGYFEKLFFRNKQFVKHYEEWRDGKKVTKDTGLFYNEIAKPFIAQLDEEIPCTYFNIQDYVNVLKNENKADDKNLIALLKILSPQHLLKTPFTNDSNELDEKFYKELLHIIGLEEAKDGAKIIIRRKKEKRNSASLIEKAIDELKTEGLHKITDVKSFGETIEEQYYTIALELCITWINRILFLKLLEGQLVNYHKGDKQYRFLNSETIHDFDELFKLFHKVLAVNIADRNSTIQQKYNRVPYLNSSLFEISDLEDITIKINSLNNSETLELVGTSILNDKKKRNDKLQTLDYLFKFLDAYDFSSEGTEDIQEDNKTLINASVLGKVFEKINGYKDGSIYTPGFITMYMCRQSIRLAVVQKFNDLYNWKIEQFEDIKNYIADKKGGKDILEYNSAINSLHLCDPAVGSGHFLVSSLNELIAIKSELGLLADSKGQRITDYEIEISNDELIVTDHNGDIFEYQLNNGKPQIKEAQRLQKTLFQEKQTIIENCLFGVDINPNSVKICRLRLWIELLKNAYYKEDTNYLELETLPNIDINIKCGNSLLSRFPLDADLSKALKSIKYDVKAYRGFVNDYKNEKSRDVKRGLQKIIDGIKKDFRTEINKNSKEYKKLQELQYEYNLLVAPNIFKEEQADYGNKNFKKENADRIKKLGGEINKRTKEFQEIESNVIYKNAFEWRFEFPEVLNNKGEFEGFDVVIGNPPYGVSIKDGQRDAIVGLLNKVPDFEIYYFFINIARKILKPNGIKTYIIPNSILFNVFAKSYRENLFNQWQIRELLDCTDFNIFEGSATVRCIITLLINKQSDDKVFYRPTANATSFEELIGRKLSETTKDILLANNQNWALVFKLNADVLNLVSKIKNNPPLSNHFDVSQGYIPYRKSDLIKLYGETKAKSIVENREWHSNTRINKEYKQEIWGTNLSKYSYSKANSFIWYGKHLAGYVDLKYFNQTRLLIREITNPTIIASIVTEELVNDPQIISIIPKSKKIPLELLWAIMNSTLATFYHFNSSPKATKGAFPKILIEDIKKFPLPTITEQQQVTIIKLVDKIFGTKKQNKDTGDLEKQLDLLVYKLYRITLEEQKIIKN